MYGLLLQARGGRRGSWRVEVVAVVYSAFSGLTVLAFMEIRARSALRCDELGHGSRVLSAFLRTGPTCSRHEQLVLLGNQLKLDQTPCTA